ncbi:MAG TPA: hypothetical protein VJ948_03855 [Acidimicrobiia bacterium]|nr:hypothetical protein [Acidimicrobiia bacterium]
MSRLPRFEEYRLLGTRDTMRVYDCDDAEEFEELRQRVDAEDLLGQNLLQSFAPDTLEEAANRGFQPVL